MWFTSIAHAGHSDNLHNIHSSFDSGFDIDRHQVNRQSTQVPDQLQNRQRGWEETSLEPEGDTCKDTA